MSLPPIFSEGETAVFATDLGLRAMTSTGSVLQHQQTRTATGGIADDQTTWTATAQTAAGIPCRVQPYLGRREGREYGRVLREENLSYWEIWLPATVSVGIENRVLVDGTQYRVLATTVNQSFEPVRRCLCLEVQ
jgi:hypothetical protein